MAGITRESVNMAEDHAYGWKEISYIPSEQYESYLRLGNLPEINQPVELAGDY